MAKYFYDFSDRQQGAFANGNGMANITAGPSGKTRSIVASGTGNAFQIVQGTVNGQDLTVFDNHTNHGDDMEMLTLFSATANVQVPGSYGALYWDYTSTNQGLSVGFLPASNVKSVILYDDKAALTVNFANFNWVNGQKYWLKWRVEGGSNHFVKIWADGTAEPSSWLFTATYSNRTTGTRYFGIGTYAANATVQYEQVSVGTGGDTAPMSVGEYVSGLQPSTPMGLYGGGYGAIGYGMATRPAFTVNTLEQSGNARIERVFSKTQVGNARIERVESLTQTGNARVQRTEQKTQQGNARIQRTESITQTGNTRVERVEQLNQTGNATIESFYVSNSINQTGNARIQRTESLNQSGNAFIIEKQRQLTQTGSAFIEKQRVVSQSGNARIERISSVSQVGNATIVWQRQLDQIGSGFVEYQRKLDQNGNAFVIAQPKIDQNGNARIEQVEQLEQIGNAKISNPTPDKLPQTWAESSKKEPETWTDEAKTDQNWTKSDEKQETAWGDGDDKAEQVWRDNDSRKPSYWQRQYYD